MDFNNLSVVDALMIAISGFLTVFIMLVLLICVVMVVSKVVGMIESKVGGKGAAAPAPAAPASAPASAAAKPEEPSTPWDGKLQLIDCDEETAACIMAIISDETDIPLDELQFRRIKAL